MQKEELGFTKHLVYCFFCERKLNEMTKIFCVSCTEIIICVKCFVEGREDKDHKKNHPYQVFDKLNFKLFGNDWTAREEIILLDGLNQNGYGNWKAISKYLGSDKDMVECEKHFHEVYLREGVSLKDQQGKKIFRTEGKFVLYK